MQPEVTIVSTGIAPTFYITSISVSFLRNLEYQTNAINDKRANFPAIYHNILKHE